MATYTVKDEKTGREVTFEWSGNDKPTEKDIESVFQAVGDREDYTKTKSTMENQAVVGSRLQNMLGNYPSSFGGLVKNAARGLVQVGRHPINTLDSLMVGFGKNVVSPSVSAMGLGNEADKANLERLKSGRYGSLENFASYMEKDPAMAQADVALALTGGGKLLESAGAISKLPALERAGKLGAEAGAMVEPLTAPLKAGGTALHFMMPSRSAQKMYASSAKMSTIMDPELRQRLSQRLLDAEVKLNNKGFKKLADDFESLWRGVDDEIEKYVTKGPNEKRTVLDLMKGLDDWEKRASLTGRSSVVRGVKNQFIRDLTEVVMVGNKPIRMLKELDAKQINRLKRDLYRELHSQYGKAMVPLKAEVKMTIAHNAMEAIEEMIPGVIPKNKTSAAYKEMMDAIQKGVNRIENRDLFSIGMPVRAGGTAVISEALGVDSKIGGIGGLALGLLDLPSVKSKVAIRLNKLKKQGVKLSPTATAIKIGLVKQGEE